MDIHSKAESEAFSKFLEWKAQVELESSFKFKTLRTDNGGEYTSMSSMNS